MYKAYSRPRRWSAPAAGLRSSCLSLEQTSSWEPELEYVQCIGLTIGGYASCAFSEEWTPGMVCAGAGALEQAAQPRHLAASGRTGLRLRCAHCSACRRTVLLRKRRMVVVPPHRAAATRCKGNLSSSVSEEMGRGSRKWEGILSTPSSFSLQLWL